VSSVELSALWRPLGQPAFRLLWLGKTLGLLADNIYLVAISWLAFELTGSGLALGGVLTVGAVPRGLLMLVGGAVTDRFDPRLLLLASQAARAVLMAAVTVGLLLGGVELWHLYLLAAGFGTVDALAYPATLAAAPRLLPPAQLNAANALVQGAEQVAGIGGPALAGLLIGLLGLPATFGAAAAALLLGALLLVPAAWARADGVAPPEEIAAEPLGRAVLAGLRFAWGRPQVRGVLLIVAALNLSGLGPVIVGGTALAESRFGAGAGGLSALLTAYGVGALLGLALAGTRQPTGDPYRGMVGLAAGIAVGLALIGVAPTILVACLIMAAMGLAVGWITVDSVTWLQRDAGPAMQGRVLSLLGFAAAALDPLSYAFAGLLLERGPTLLFAAAGGLLLAASALAATRR